MFIRLWHIYYDGFSHLPKWGKILIAKSNHVLNELITKP